MFLDKKMTQVVRSHCSAASAMGSFGNIFVGDEWVGLAIMSKVGEIVVMDHNRVTLDLLIQWRIFSLVPGPTRLDHVFDFDRFKLEVGPSESELQVKVSFSIFRDNSTGKWNPLVHARNLRPKFLRPLPNTITLISLRQKSNIYPRNSAANSPRLKKTRFDRMLVDFSRL
jgi:hypothetical protein